MTHRNRRSFVKCGFAGVAASAVGRLRAAESVDRSAGGAGRAKSCIVLFCWGGVSHLDTLDSKPEGPNEIRSEFASIATSTPGVQVCEHLPGFASRTHHWAIVRSVHHEASDHREAAYWNLTGRAQARRGLQLPARSDWPSLGAMVAFARRNHPDRDPTLPGTFSPPHPMADRGLLNGQYAGMLGTDYEPVFVSPKGATPYDGVSPEAPPLSLERVPEVDAARLAERRSLLGRLGEVSAFAGAQRDEPLAAHDAYRARAFEMIGGERARNVFDLSREPAEVLDAYGDHVCGRSVLTARRLTDAGVPLVTVTCNAGDLNGGGGAHWDTHGDGFRRLRRDLLPPLDRAAGALLDDLERTGRLAETLVVLFTEFGRTPKLKRGGGRDHFPNCYSVAFAGGGIRGGAVYGRSDATGSEPVAGACGPEELHATVFHALGIGPEATFVDLSGRPRPLYDAEPLPLF